MLIRFKNFLRFCNLLLFVSILSCGRESKTAQTVKVGGAYRLPITTDLTSLDPISEEFYSWTIGSQIFEGLVAYSTDEARIIPVLAENFTANDSFATFHLRKGVKFHDDLCFPGGKGREFVAADVKYSLKIFFKIMKLRKVPCPRALFTSIKILRGSIMIPTRPANY